ncbi:MAG TPA: hypothetical protein ENF17_05410 [Candidatus Aminicenantes bacterium]|nr:hypothetical protein [Candidatus Aminicenantes bacterium]
MAYLIDGNNLTGYLFAPFLHNPESREWVVEILLIFQKIKKTKVIIVFDGPPQAELEEMAQSNDRLEVLFPPPGEKADKVIIDILANRTNKKNFWVITTDREIRTKARELGFKSLASAEFAQELKRVRKRHQRFLEHQKETITPTPLEIQHWVELFSQKKK